MITSLNEESLLNFLYKTEEKSFGFNSELINLLNNYDVEVKNVSTGSLYDIIEEYEND